MTICCWLLPTKSTKLGTTSKHLISAISCLREILIVQIIFCYRVQFTIRSYADLLTEYGIFIFIGFVVLVLRSYCLTVLSVLVLAAWLRYLHFKEWRSSPNWSSFCWMLWQHGKCVEGTSLNFCESVGFIFRLIALHDKASLMKTFRKVYKQTCCNQSFCAFVSFWLVVYLSAGEREYRSSYPLLLGCHWGKVHESIYVDCVLFFLHEAQACLVFILLYSCCSFDPILPMRGPIWPMRTCGKEGLTRQLNAADKLLHWILIW